MTSIISFKKELIGALNNCQKLSGKISGVYSGLIEGVSLPVVKFSNLIVEDWSSVSSNGRVFNVSLEVMTRDISSKSCIEIIDLIEDYLPTLNNIFQDFVVSRIKILGSKINFIKAERLWCGEIKVKFWIETIH